MNEQEDKQIIPLYSVNLIELGTITVAEALILREAGEMILTIKGRGRNRRYTSARYIITRSRFEDWRPKESAGYIVMQLET